MLACIRLGAVMIPATTLLSAADLADRIERGEVRAVVAGAGRHRRSSPTSPATDPDRASASRSTAGCRYDDAFEHLTTFSRRRRRHTADDPLLLYFTSGTTAQPKLVEHTHASYPVGHLSTMYWIGLQPGDVHLNISSPGWAKHAWSCVFAPWNAGATSCVYNYARFDAAALLDADGRGAA